MGFWAVATLLPEKLGLKQQLWVITWVRGDGRQAKRTTPTERNPGFRARPDGHRVRRATSGQLASWARASATASSTQPRPITTVDISTRWAAQHLKRVREGMDDCRDVLCAADGMRGVRWGSARSS